MPSAHSAPTTNRRLSKLHNQLLLLLLPVALLLFSP